MDLLEINTFTKFAKEWALVSSGTKKNANTMTIGWGGVGVIWGKNVAYVFVRDSRYTKELMDQGDFFSVAFLNEEYREALTRASELRSLRNKLSKEIGQFMREGKREEALIDIWCRNENLQSSHQQVCSSLSYRILNVPLLVKFRSSLV